MSDFIGTLIGSLGWVELTLGAVALAITVLYATGAFRYIPNTRIRVAEKPWSRKGSVVSGIALRGEAGFEPEVLAAASIS